MKTIKGKFNEAKIMASQVEETALEQIKELTNNEHIKDANLVFMPDVHAGKGCTIGTTIRFEDPKDLTINPEWVGNDIGCSVSVFRLGSKEEINLDFDKLDELSKTLDKPSPTSEWHPSESFYFWMGKDITKKAQKEIGRISGGNHMMEIGEMNGDYYVTIHNGSLFLGQHVYKKYIDYLQEKSKVDVKPIIANLKEQGHHQYIETVINSIKRKQAETKEERKYLFLNENWRNNIMFNSYISDVELCEEYAHANHIEVYRRILKALNIPYDFLKPDYLSTHNFIDKEYRNRIVSAYTIYKGATPAKKGEDVIIPINMRDGVIVGKGKGNPEWNYSAPHGAGRQMSRTQAKNNIELDTYLDQMKDVRSISINENTLDEAPDAYKPIEYILDSIKDTVEVEGIIKPLYNYKVAEEEPYWMKKKKEKDNVK